jgi:hypothetical protein
LFFSTPLIINSGYHQSQIALRTTGGKTAEVPVLRLRQAFWLFAVGGCAARFFLSGALRLLTFFICLLL